MKARVAQPTMVRSAARGQWTAGRYRSALTRESAAAPVLQPRA